MLKKTSLALAALLLSAGFAYGQKITTITEKFEGNTLSIRVQIDSFKNGCIAMGNEQEYIFEKREKMQSLNGKDVYCHDDEASEPVGAAAQSDFLNYITKAVQDELNTSKNAPSIKAWMDIIIDEKGDLGFVRFIFFDDDDDAEIEVFRRRVIEILKGMHFVPAMHNGKAVPYATRIGVNNDF